MPRSTGRRALAGDGVTFGALVARLAARAAGPHRSLVGITGSPASGKSTLVEALLRELAGTGAVAHVPMDGFHLADVALRGLGRLDAKGAPDTFDAGGYVACLRRVRAAAEDVVWVPAFERDLEQPLAGAVPVPRRARLVLTEGNYLLLDTGRWAEVAPLLDETWFCAPDEHVRAERLLARHVAFGKEPATAAAWMRAVDEPNAALVAATRDRADLVIGPDVLDALPVVGR